MALVSISEVAKLTNKNRVTIYRKIKSGELSATTDKNSTQKLYTSELLRVFGELKTVAPNKSRDSKKQHRATVENAIDFQARIKQLEQQLGTKDELLNEKQKHIESLSMAMRLLEDKTQNKKIKGLVWKTMEINA